MSQPRGFERLRSSNNQTVAQSSALAHTRTPKSPVFYAHSKAAAIRPATDQYPQTHLLGLPLEIRQQIWQAITNIIATDSLYRWYRKPANDFSGLTLTSRQTYEETQGFWRRYQVPWNRLQKFLQLPVNKTTIQNYEFLTIEVQLDAHLGYFSGLATVLHRAQPYLRELRLYFKGPDKYGRNVHSRGCGSNSHDTIEAKLPIDGQRLEEMLPLWNRIVMLRRLEVLVISNANLQLYEPMLLIGKPWLEYLHITTDQRSVAHNALNVNDLGFLMNAVPAKNSHPPIKVLQIPANATLSANSLIAKVAPTLQHLSWIVPDASLQSSRSLDWIDRTAELMLALRMRGKNLQTLRICISGAGIYETEIYGRVLGGVKLHLPYLSNLRHFELHFKSKSYWFGQEIIAGFPNGLENAYLTDRTIHITALKYQVWERYLKNDTRYTVESLPLQNVGSSAPRYRTPAKDQKCRRSQQEKKLELGKDDGPWLIDATSFSYNVPLIENNMNGLTESTKALHLLHRNKSARHEFKPGFRDDPHFTANQDSDTSLEWIGEDHHRRDFIPFHTGNLRFIHYEYDTNDLQTTEEDSPTIFQTALLINGRLLDRERNRHLAQYKQGSHIPCKQSIPRVTSAKETATRSENLQYSVMLYELYALDSSRMKDIAMHMSDLRSCPDFRDDERYFGHEDAAVQVFERELVATVDSLPPLHYPVELEVPCDGHCRWMSPEAPVPSLTTRKQRFEDKKLSC